MTHWQRQPQHDMRTNNDDDFDGDAWRNDVTDELRFTAVGEKPTAQTISFNTGRKYTAEGQFIVATLHNDGVVTFMDHSRHIDGQFQLGQHCSFNQTEVMHWYDSGQAHGTTRSWRDGTLRGACNTR